MTRVFVDRRALAKAVFGRGQHRLVLVARHQQRDDLLPFFELHAAHTACFTTHRPHVVFVEANRLAGIREQHDVVLAVGNGSANQVVAVIQTDRNNTLAQRRLKASSGVFFTVPNAVAMNTNLSAENSLTGNTTVIFSPS